MDQLTNALSIYQTIRERIIALDANIDETTLADSLEGLSDLNEVVASIVRAALIDEALAIGLKGHIEVMGKRLQRLADRAAARRRIARDAMVEVDIKKIIAPDFTLSVRPGSPALVVVDEASIPQTYWQPSEPRLDRFGLLGDLKIGRPVPGVQLSNPEPVLSVRVK